MTLKQRIGRYLIPRLPVSRLVFDLLRDELNRIAVRTRWRVSPLRRRERRRLLGLRDVYVDVACGPESVPGFVRLDLNGAAPDAIAWDCARSLPFADGSCLGIRVEHFLEHVETREDLPRFLAACRAALRPGGVLRVVVPDAGAFLRAYCAEGDEGFAALGWPPPFPAELPTRMDVVNHVFHQFHEHRWGYDLETLSHRLEAAGFAEIAQVRYGESRDPMLVHDRAVHAPYSLYVEAVRPPA